MNLIGISGKKESGKNTVARIIAEYNKSKFVKLGEPREVHELAFADALKEEVAKACGVTVEYINKNKDQYRPILQWWGTDFRRKQDDNYWINQMSKKLFKLPNDSLVLITDVRFPNEANFINEINGVLWRVVRIHKDFDEAVDGHASEIALDDYPIFSEMIVNNADTVEELKPRVINIYNKYYGKTTV